LDGVRRRLRQQSIDANISGGIAIAISAWLVRSATTVNVPCIERWRHAHVTGRSPAQRWNVINRAAAEVGPALVPRLAYHPCFLLPAGISRSARRAGGRLFAPLAFLQSYAMVIAAILSVT
jgi:Cu/Ag efflux pump CusA